MKTEPDLIALISKELVPTMRHMLPVLGNLLTAMQEGESATKQQLAELQAVMERIAAGLEKQTHQLQIWEQQRMAQNPAIVNLSQQMREISHYFGREAENRSRLEAKLDRLNALLTE